MSGWSDDTDPNAMLVGAEAYNRMLSDCDERLALAAARIEGYEGTRGTLKSLVRTAQQELMVPVAGGLGYFEGVIRHTNSVLVLLGDNIFAERSVHDALGIADRRLGYLNAERTALEAERRDIVDKQRLFVECGVMGSPTDSKAALRSGGGPQQQKATKGVGGGGATNVSVKAPGPVAVPAAASAPAANNAANKAEEQHGGDENDGGGDGFYGDEEEEDNGDDFIDPQDELTLDELIALEEELGDDINDEERAEAAIMDLVNKKKALRLAQQAAAMGVVAAPSADAGNKKAAAAPSAASSQTPAAASSSGASASPSPSSVDKKKQVHFDASVATTEPSEQQQQEETCPMPGGMGLTAAATAFASPADIGRLFQNIGGAAGDVKQGFEGCEPSPTTAATTIPAAAVGSSSQSNAASSYSSSATAAAAHHQPIDPSNPLATVAPFDFSAAAAAQQQQQKTAGGGPSINADVSGPSGGPVRNVVVERNISGAMGAVGENSSGGIVAHGAGLGPQAPVATAAGPTGNSAPSVTVKKRSLFGQGMGLK